MNAFCTVHLLQSPTRPHDTVYYGHMYCISCLFCSILLISLVIAVLGIRLYLMTCSGHFDTPSTALSHLLLSHNTHTILSSILYHVVLIVPRPLLEISRKGLGTRLIYLYWYFATFQYNETFTLNSLSASVFSTKG